MLSGLISTTLIYDHGEHRRIMPTDLPDFAAATLATDRPSDYDKIARKSRRKVILWVVVSLLVVGGCLGAVEWRYLTTRWVGDAKVGECLTSTGVNEENANGVKVVDCDDAEAFYRVIGITRDASYFDACGEFPEAAAGIYVPPESGSTARMVCVEEIGLTAG